MFPLKVRSAYLKESIGFTITVSPSGCPRYLQQLRPLPFQLYKWATPIKGMFPSSHSPTLPALRLRFRAASLVDAPSAVTHGKIIALVSTCSSIFMEARTGAVDVCAEQQLEQ